MAKIVKQHVPLGQISVPTTEDTIANLLSLTTDDDCLYQAVIVQADPSNGDEIYFGGVDASGAPDAAQAKSIKLTAGQGLALEADANGGDEDNEVYDLRQMSLKAGSTGYKANISVIKISSVKYNK